MLGWMFKVERLAVAVTRSRLHDLEKIRNQELARWEASMTGGKWLFDLEQQGKAEQLNFGGYPDSFLLRASIFKETFKDGPPRHDGPLVIGDDYVIPGDYISKIELHKERIADVKDDEWLIVYMWDQS